MCGGGGVVDDSPSLDVWLAAMMTGAAARTCFRHLARSGYSSPAARLQSMKLYIATSLESITVGYLLCRSLHSKPAQPGTEHRCNIASCQGILARLSKY